MEETDLIFLWGSNARETHPIFFHHVLKGVRNGAQLYVVDPRRTASAQWAHVWLGLDVGSDIALANAMAREIIVSGLGHRWFIEHATSGFEAYKNCVEKYGPRTFGMFSCSKTTNELNYISQKFVRSVIGGNNIDSCNRT